VRRAPFIPPIVQFHARADLVCTAPRVTPDKLSVALHAGKYLDRTRWANLTFFCDASSESKEPTSWSYKRTETEGVLSVEFANKFACPLNSQGQPDPNGDGTSRAKQGSGVIAFFRNFVFLCVEHGPLGSSCLSENESSGLIYPVIFLQPLHPSHCVLCLWRIQPVLAVR
jgi:hypothetical protein